MSNKKTGKKFDEFDDEFVDKDEFSKPNDVSGKILEDGVDETCDVDESEDDVVIDTLVLNVDITGNEGCRILRFDILEYSRNGARYTSKYYCLDTPLGTNGIFDMLDDYFVRRFRFLHSSKICQAFMTSLVDVEEILRETNGYNFFKLCADVSKKTVNELKKISDEEPNDILWNGYGISKESYVAFMSKHEAMNDDAFSWIATEILKRFNFYKEYIETKHFCAICIQHNDEYVKPNIVEDVAISLPLVVYIPKFAKIICEKVANTFLSSDVFQNIGIDELSTDLFLLMPNTNMNDLKSLYNKNLKIKDFENIEDNEFIIGKYKTFKFTEESFSEKEETIDSIIGYS